MLLPRQKLLLYMYVRKEAVLSSQIEGTQSTLSDLLRFETEAQAGTPIDDVREVSNYVNAMMFGLELGAWTGRAAMLDAISAPTRRGDFHLDADGGVPCTSCEFGCAQRDVYRDALPSPAARA